MPDEPAVRGYVVGPGEGVPDRTPDVKASGRSTGGSLTVMELAVDGGPPRHTHTREDESFYVFTGVVDVECGQDRFEAGPGSFVFLPRNLPHAFRSVGGPVTALLIVTPGGLDSYFAELHVAMSSNADPAEVKRSRTPTASCGPDRPAGAGLRQTHDATYLNAAVEDVPGRRVCRIFIYPCRGRCAAA